MLILDTDVLIELSKKHSKRKLFVKKCIIETKDELGTTAINYEEFLFGYIKSKGKPQTENPLLSIKVFPFNKKDAQLAAQLEVEMEKKGFKRPRIDVMIPSIVINNEATLFTLNKKHYEGIPGLKLLICEKRSLS